MGRWRDYADSWLSSETRGLDEAADAAFAAVFAALPDIEPSAAFIQRAAEAAWTARARRRRMTATAAVAASVLAAAIGGAIVYAAFGAAAGWLLTAAAALVTSVGVSLLSAVATTLEWWLATAHVGSSVARVVTRPEAAAALLGIELVGIGALYMLRRVLHAELRLRGARTLYVLA